MTRLVEDNLRHRMDLDPREPAQRLQASGYLVDARLVGVDDDQRGVERLDVPRSEQRGNTKLEEAINVTAPNENAKTKRPLPVGKDRIVIGFRQFRIEPLLKGADVMRETNHATFC